MYEDRYLVEEIVETLVRKQGRVDIELTVNLKPISHLHDEIALCL